MYFSGQVTQNMNFPIDNKSSKTRSQSRNFFSRIQIYNHRASASPGKENQKKFCFLKMCVCFSEVNNLDPAESRLELGEAGLYLFITATPLTSPYTAPHQEGPVRYSSASYQSYRFWSTILEFLITPNTIHILNYWTFKMCWCCSLYHPIL